MVDLKYFGVGLQHVLRSNNEAPSCPDGTGGEEGHVLCEGELLGGAEEVACASGDDAPFHDLFSIDVSIHEAYSFSCPSDIPPVSTSTLLRTRSCTHRRPEMHRLRPNLTVP